jgi:hypothetical protein
VGAYRPRRDGGRGGAHAGGEGGDEVAAAAGERHGAAVADAAARVVGDEVRACGTADERAYIGPRQDQDRGLRSQTIDAGKDLPDGRLTKARACRLSNTRESIGPRHDRCLR